MSRLYVHGVGRLLDEPDALWSDLDRGLDSDAEGAQTTD